MTLKDSLHQTAWQQCHLHGCTYIHSAAVTVQAASTVPANPLPPGVVRVRGWTTQLSRTLDLGRLGCPGRLQELRVDSPANDAFPSCKERHAPPSPSPSASRLNLRSGERLQFTLNMFVDLLLSIHLACSIVCRKIANLLNMNCGCRLLSFNPAFLLLVKQQPALAHLGASLLKFRIFCLGFRV